MPVPNSVRLTVVIPVYNGERFLESTLERACTWLDTRSFGTELLIVDDGSSDRTPELLAEFAAARPPGTSAITILRNEPNRGKGFALRRGFLHASGDLILFTDADLTYPMENCEPLVSALTAGADVAYGNRTNPGSRYVVAPTFFGKLFTRHLMGRIFNLLLRIIVLPGIYDSQAGLKGFRREAARKLAGRVSLPRFSFDVELLYAARALGMTIVDCPVRFVYRKEPSTVHFVRDSLAMLRDMLLVRWRGLRGIYRREPEQESLRELLDGAADHSGV